MHRTETYEEFDFDMHAALAVQNQLDERGAKMETEWKKKRICTDRKSDQKKKVIKQQCKEAIEEQASIQVSLIEHKTNSAHGGSLQ